MPTWPPPRRVASSDEANRADQGNTIRADEFLDAPEVLEAKIRELARLVRQSRFTVAYTGAGLSKTAGIPDYATRAKDSVMAGVPRLRSSLDAQPTLAHHVLVSMDRAGWLHHYVQQNHDGLPQKAGYPQEKINEIHGAWYDPSNPVVPFSGSLRDDLFGWMLEMEARADLCLCLGTSLSGMNADRMAATPAEKAACGEALGTVIINLQRTGLDEAATLRIWAKLDDAFALLARELGLPVPDMREATGMPAPEGDVFEVPYNAQGQPDPSVRMRLDLRKGATLTVPVDGAPTRGRRARVEGRDREGNIRVRFEGARRANVLGRWWIDAALRGVVPQLPVVNAAPVVRKAPEDLAIVQSHQELDGDEGNRHLWSLHLEGSEEAGVKAVEWHLHPTFSPAVVRVNRPPFALERRGWGTFAVKAVIELSSAQRLEAVHELNFDGVGERAHETRVSLR